MCQIPKRGSGAGAKPLLPRLPDSPSEPPGPRLRTALQGTETSPVPPPKTSPGEPESLRHFPQPSRRSLRSLLQDRFEAPDDPPHGLVGVDLEPLLQKSLLDRLPPVFCIGRNEESDPLPFPFPLPDDCSAHPYPPQLGIVV